MFTLLIIDDEPNLLYSLKKALFREGLRIHTAETAAAGIEQVRRTRPDAVVLDVRLPDGSGLDAFVEIRRIDPRLPVIIITAFSTAETAIEAMKRGAYEYLLKPVDVARLEEVIERALSISRMSHVPAMIDQGDASLPPAADLIVGRSTAMQEVYKTIGRVAPQDVTVLILGETGTGKEMVARAIYHHSRRSGGPFLAVNCAAIPDALLESELFGHERGAFTGAESRRIGKFEQVHGGTLFLDEIGDMSSATQAKVLRLLQEGSFERVGSNEPLQADVRVIAATNRDLETLVEQGAFRHDLYYRLHVFSILLPPLRARMDDLPALTEHFIRTFNQDLGRDVRAVAPDALERLMRHTWPGNVRELQSAVKFALVHAVGETITPDCLPPVCRDSAPVEIQAEPSAADGLGEVLAGIGPFVSALLERSESDVYRTVHSEVDRILLEHVLNRVGGNQVQAAHLLGISRSTLRTRISDLELAFETRVAPEQAAD